LLVRSYNTGVPRGFVLVGALLVLAMLSTGATAQPEAPHAPVSLDEAIARALEQNPTLAAARLGRAVALATIDVARERPNPDFTFETARDTPHETFSTAWTIETGGKRARRVEVATAGLARTDAELARTTAAVVNDVRRAYAALVTSRRRAAVIADLRDLAARARDAARDRFESGAAPRLEALQAEVALAQAENEVATARALAAAARVTLNVVLNHPPAAPLVPVDDVPTPPMPAAEDLLARVLGRSPELSVLDEQIAEAAARVALARALQRPDPTADVGLTYDAPPEFQYGWKVGLTVALPVLTRHRAGVRLEEAAVAQLRAERAAAAARIRGAVLASAARAAAQRDAYTRYRDDILPKIDEVERMAEDSYRSGQTGLTALLQSVQSARDIRLRAVDAAADYQAAIADLEQAGGGSVR
jgi:outer membrane protein, heavy metal efflux system